MCGTVRRSSSTKIRNDTDSLPAQASRTMRTEAKNHNVDECVYHLLRECERTFVPYWVAGNVKKTHTHTHVNGMRIKRRMVRDVRCKREKQKTLGRATSILCGLSFVWQAFEIVERRRR